MPHSLLPSIEITDALITLNAAPRDKEHAMQMLIEMLVAENKVDAGYLAGMKAREQQENTYLGNGIAIPHGTPETKALIKETAIAVLHVPQGLSWGVNGELAYVLVGIAAKGDEHLGILRRLTRILNHPDKLKVLQAGQDKASMAQLLNETPAQILAQSALPAGDKTPPSNLALEFGAKVVIPNPQGIHARPATKLARLAKQLGGKITLVMADGRRADPSKMIEVLGLGLTQGTAVRIEADNRDTLKQIVQAFEEGLGDDLTAVETSANPQSALFATDAVGVRGVSASDGMAIGIVRHFQAHSYTLPTTAQSALVEAQALDKALDNVAALLAKNVRELSAEYGAIFEAHLELLRDEEWLAQTVALIDAGLPAARAYHQAAQGQIEALQALDNPTLAARAHDVMDVRDRVIRSLLGIAEPSFDFGANTLLCADDLAPSDTAKLNPAHLVGLVTAQGGATSHTAILARGMGLPAVVAIGAQGLQQLPEGATAIIDARAGVIYVNPDAAQLKAAKTAIAAYHAQSALVEAKAHEVAQTSDGRVVEVVANANNVKELQSALTRGAEGVGLMRTEALYLDRVRIPTEDEQYEEYRAMAEALGDKPLIIRTLDIGGDKEVPYLGLEEEQNAFLGMRGIRLCFERPDLFLPQLRAIARAAQAFKNIHIMFPMMTTFADWQRAKALWLSVAAEFGVEAVPLGVMIEVPAAALIADKLAEEVAFFSIGTNDLTQYTLAMDRMNAKLAQQSDPLHPAVLQLIDRTVRAAEKAGKWVGVCGGAAGDVVAAQVFVGLGVKELSVAGREIAAIKQMVRDNAYAELAQKAQSALACVDGAAVRALFTPTAS